ncbi:MAG: PhenylacetateCoA oxygenase PaaJ subunit [Frankiales bacterium]|nr:PhenylacetateCoA oxygenase PaaJ subunit [Frankiales bacterium]
MSSPRDTVRDAWDLLGQVPDPELPTVSVVDLGIAREVAVDGQRVVVTITPTYSGCPAMREIEHDVRAALAGRFAVVEVRIVLSPPWTTDWITPQGRARLTRSGIAPPGVRLLPLLTGDRPAACPRCGSATVEELSGFGSTACKALWRCLACREPFDYVKAH